MPVQMEMRKDVLIAEPDRARISAEDFRGIDEIRDMFAAALKKSARALVVNLSRVQFIDSPGLGAFISGHMTLRGKCSIHLCCVAEDVEKTLVHTRMNLLFPLYASVNEALKAINKK